MRRLSGSPAYNQKDNTHLLHAAYDLYQTHLHIYLCPTFYAGITDDFM